MATKTVCVHRYVMPPLGDFVKKYYFLISSLLFEYQSGGYYRDDVEVYGFNEREMQVITSCASNFYADGRMLKAEDFDIYMIKELINVLPKEWKSTLIDHMILSSIDKSEQIREAFNSLMVKGLVSLESVKDIENRLNEVVVLDGVYSSVIDNTISETKEDVKEDVFKVFERELGRTMSSMELELINGWLISGTPEELILGALREAIYNGVTNFRYIDKIIYEWEKKGFKTMDDVNAYIKNRREEKSKDKVISKKEQDILDYDWLDA